MADLRRGLADRPLRNLRGHVRRFTDGLAHMDLDAILRLRVAHHAGQVISHVATDRQEKRHERHVGHTACGERRDRIIHRGLHAFEVSKCNRLRGLRAHLSEDGFKRCRPGGVG